MDFDPYTGLPWGTNPFKATSKQTYEPLFGPSQPSTGLLSNGKYYSRRLSGVKSPENFALTVGFTHLQLTGPQSLQLTGPQSQFFSVSTPPSNFVQSSPFLSPAGPSETFPLTLASSTPFDGFDFDYLFHGAGCPPENKSNENDDFRRDLFQESQDPFSSFFDFESGEKSPGFNFPAEDTTPGPIDFTSHDLEELFSKMKNIGTQPPKCVTPPPRQQLQVPPAPKSKAAFGQFPSVAIPPESPTKEAVSRRKRIGKKNPRKLPINVPERDSPLSNSSNIGKSPQSIQQVAGCSQLSSTQTNPNFPHAVPSSTNSPPLPHGLFTGVLPAQLRSSGSQLNALNLPTQSSYLGTSPIGVSQASYMQPHSSTSYLTTPDAFLNPPTLNIRGPQSKSHGEFATSMWSPNGQSISPSTAKFPVSEGNTFSFLGNKVATQTNNTDVFSGASIYEKPQGGNFSNQYSHLNSPIPIFASQDEISPHGVAPVPGNRQINSQNTPELLLTPFGPASSHTFSEYGVNPQFLQPSSGVQSSPNVQLSPEDQMWLQKYRNLGWFENTNGQATQTFPSLQQPISNQILQTDPSLISPKTSTTSFPTEISSFATNLSNHQNAIPRINQASLSEGKSISSSSHVNQTLVTPRKNSRTSKILNKNLTPENMMIPKSVNPSGNKTNAKCVKNDFSKASSPTRSNRTFSSSSSSAIFVNFTSKDSKKLLSGVAPSGSSKRKKTLENDDEGKTDQDPRSDLGLRRDGIKRQRVLGN